jgi:hypothetical protein
MRSKVLGTLIVATLGACSTPQASVGTPDGSSVASITPGMTRAQVGAILGDYQREDFDASNGYSSCRSYAYGASPNRRYVHVYYYEEVVETATDGHVALCLYGGDIVG